MLRPEQLACSAAEDVQRDRAQPPLGLPQLPEHRPDQCRDRLGEIDRRLIERRLALDGDRAGDAPVQRQRHRQHLRPAAARRQPRVRGPAGQRFVRRAPETAASRPGRPLLPSPR